MDDKLVWFEWMQQQGAAEQLDIRWNPAPEYSPSVRPVHADMKKSWHGR